MSLSLDKALQRLQEHPASSGTPLPVIAGGTDFYPALGDRTAPADFLDLTAIDELKGIGGDARAGWRIGAAVTWSELQRTPLPACFDALKQAGREVGSRQIQNRATLAGNLCNASPAADGVPALLILDAEVELASLGGRRRLALAEFLLGVRQTARAPDELLVAIHVPPQAGTAASAFHKLGSRRYLVISIAMLAVLVDLGDGGVIEDVRIAVGACSPVARRLTAFEQVIQRQTVGELDSKTIRERMLACNALATLSPIDDVRGSAAYRLEAVATLLERTLCRLLHPSGSAVS